jgi:hypothetical protein
LDAESQEGPKRGLNIKALSFDEQGFYVPAKAVNV